MARIRTIKPEFPQSESMGRVTRDARLLFIELWTIADDSGRLRGNSRMLASLLFPYDEDAGALIDGWLEQLERESCVRRYKANGDSYLQVCNWNNHQKIDKPSASKLPNPLESSRTFANPLEHSSEDQGPKDQGRDRGPKEMDRGLDPEMVARAVMETCSISGRFLLNSLADVCRSRMKAGDDPEWLRDKMCSAWKEYDALRDGFSVSAEKFFGEGKWNNKASWKKENGNGLEARNQRAVNKALADLDREPASGYGRPPARVVP